MSGSPKEKLEQAEAEETTTDEREVYLRDGRKLVVSESGTDQLVEIRSGSGMVEVRIRLTEQGPVLQMEAVRLQLKADEAVTIESKAVEIRATEGSVKVESKEEVDIDAEGAVRVVGKTIHLN